MSQTGDEAGYTLTELLVVLAIIAVFAAIVPASYRAIIPSAQLSHSTASIVSLLRQARSQAVGTSQDIQITIDATGRQVSLQEGGREIVLPEPLEASYVRAFAAGENEQQESQTQLSFFGDGGSTGGILTVTGPHSSRDIHVHWLLGGVSVQ